MKNNNQITSFWIFLKKNTIEIPILQRDYAQGREGKEYLRKKFLLRIKEAIKNFPNESLTLDFVYGSIQNGKLSLLDGQQRFTTLWLIHWYLALMSGSLDKNTCDILKNFSYETRLSSRDFCECLCNCKYFDKDDFTRKESIVDFIVKQTWFYSSWKQDPTIQSMLRMLGGFNKTEKEFSIEGIFDQSDYKDYWQKLVSDNPPIVFYHLILEDFGLSDELYIKMNSRGKQLTPYENFKADLIDYLRKKADTKKIESDKSEKWGAFLDPLKGIPIKLDTEWTDALFWKNRSTKVNKIDEILFAFINRFFWNELFSFKINSDYLLKLDKESLSDDLSNYSSENDSFRLLTSDPYDQYTSFDLYKFYEKNIPIEFFERFIKILNNLCDYFKHHNELPCCSWDTDFHFIPKYMDKSDLQVSPITQIYRIIFFSLCKYFSEGSSYEEESLKKWMRVVWNLVSGKSEDGKNEIRNIQSVRTAIEFIDKLNSHEVYESLLTCCYKKDSFSDFDLRCNEEIEKAKQILSHEGRVDGTSWEDVIIEAENYGFFNGSIRFLFQNEEGGIDWSNFDKKFSNAQIFFNNNVNSENDKSDNYVMQFQYKNGNLLKKLFSWFSVNDFENVLWYKHKTFNNRPESWLYYLLNNKICKAVHYFMLNEENPKPISSLEEDNYYNNALYWLINSSLLDFVIKKIPTSWIRVYYDHLAIYPSRAGVYLDSVNRDKLLAELNKNKIFIEETHLIEGTTLLYGSDINFIYRYNGHSYCFQWYRDDKVYFMDEDFSSYKKTNDAGSEQYYCFDTKESEEEISQDSFINKLNKLIVSAQYYEKQN